MRAVGHIRFHLDVSKASHVFYGAALVFCAVVFWAAIPTLWFVIAVYIEDHGASKTTSILLTHGGVLLTAACAVKVISVLQRAYTGQWFLARGEERRRTPEEPLMVIGAVLAIIGVVLWAALGGGCLTSSELCP